LVSDELYEEADTLEPVNNIGMMITDSAGACNNNSGSNPFSITPTIYIICHVLSNDCNKCGKNISHKYSLCNDSSITRVCLSREKLRSTTIGYAVETDLSIHPVLPSLGS